MRGRLRSDQSECQIMRSRPLAAPPSHSLLTSLSLSLSLPPSPSYTLPLSPSANDRELELQKETAKLIGTFPFLCVDDVGAGCCLFSLVFSAHGAHLISPPPHANVPCPCTLARRYNCCVFRPSISVLSLSFSLPPFLPPCIPLSLSLSLSR